MNPPSMLALVGAILAARALRAPGTTSGRQPFPAGSGIRGLASVAPRAAGWALVAGVAATSITGGLGAAGAALAMALLVVSRGRRRRGRGTARAAIAIERDLPDVLDLLATSVAAGVPLDGALAWTAMHAPPAVAGPLSQCVELLAAGAPRRHAFALLESGPSSDLARVGAALAVADSLGAPLAAPLREQASLQRELRRTRVRERAARASPKIAITVGFLLVPAALLIVLGAEMLATFGAEVG